MKFYRLFIYFSSLLVLSSYITDAVICTENYACDAASKFNIYLTASPETLKKKECNDGCTNFFCVVENKTKVILGGGCYSDYEKVCKDAPADAKIDDIKSLNSTPIIVAAIGHFLIFCKTERCADFLLDRYVSDYLYFFNTKFLDGIDQSYNEKCEYPEKSTVKLSPIQTSTTKPSEDKNALTTVTTTNGGLMNQMNGFYFFGSLFSVYISAAQLW